MLAASGGGFSLSNRISLAFKEFLIAIFHFSVVALSFVCGSYIFLKNYICYLKE